MIEWVVTIVLALICICLFVYTIHLTRSRNEVEEELYRYIRDNMKDDDR